MEKQFYPYFDADIQAQVRATLGEDKMLVFDNETKTIHLAQKIGNNYAVSINESQLNIKNMIQQMEEGTWQRKSS